MCLHSKKYKTVYKLFYGACAEQWKTLYKVAYGRRWQIGLTVVDMHKRVHQARAARASYVYKIDNRAKNWRFVYSTIILLMSEDVKEPFIFIVVNLIEFNYYDVRIRILLFLPSSSSSLSSSNTMVWVGRIPRLISRSASSRPFGTSISWLAWHHRTNEKLAITLTESHMNIVVLA